MRALSPLLLAAGALGAAGTLVLAAMGETETALRTASAACAVLVLGMLLRR
ncbi:hypothetical protein [Roseomonas indoligenes]|uniref:Uncharacterized protein n=1 Tax=Roseomonas indoligenes TaxID=2820811 RepID=A0A940MVR2_9PROT|nr:hypothetical protein [Pararoseomonas indoligenes]MBP0494314.1 hypothetical protein [Pararoseomonas indoligenes]